MSPSFLQANQSLVSLSFDSDLPHDCDDEFWMAMPDETRFQQPADRPSSMSCFIALIGLARILASILTQLVRFCAMCPLLPIARC